MPENNVFAFVQSGLRSPLHLERCVIKLLKKLLPSVSERDVMGVPLRNQLLLKSTLC